MHAVLIKNYVVLCTLLDSKLVRKGACA